MSLKVRRGAPEFGDVVLRHDPDTAYYGTPDSFYVVPNGFDKYGLRSAGQWKWDGDRWRFPATERVITRLAAAYGSAFAIDPSAVARVETLLGPIEARPSA